MEMVEALSLVSGRVEKKILLRTRVNQTRGASRTDKLRTSEEQKTLSSVKKKLKLRKKDDPSRSASSRSNKDAKRIENTKTQNAKKTDKNKNSVSSRTRASSNGLMTGQVTRWVCNLRKIHRWQWK